MVTTQPLVERKTKRAKTSLPLVSDQKAASLLDGNGNCTAPLIDMWNAVLDLQCAPCYPPPFPTWYEERLYWRFQQHNPEEWTENDHETCFGCIEDMMTDGVSKEALLFGNSSYFRPVSYGKHFTHRLGYDTRKCAQDSTRIRMPHIIRLRKQPSGVWASEIDFYPMPGFVPTALYSEWITASYSYRAGVNDQMQRKVWVPLQESHPIQPPK
jgi:hypothetical protein